MDQNSQDNSLNNHSIYFSIKKFDWLALINTTNKIITITVDVNIWFNTLINNLILLLVQKLMLA